MAKTISYGWRLLATGLYFFSFCLDGLLLRMLVFPILSILPGDRLQQISRGQKAVRYSFYVFIGLMHRMGIMTYKIVGLEKLNRPGQLIIANHPTLVDIVF
jgi:1-acyl-sn-glycerol-3-phosphate acyltransferase